MKSKLHDPGTMGNYESSKTYKDDSYTLCDLEKLTI